MRILVFRPDGTRLLIQGSAATVALNQSRTPAGTDVRVVTAPGPAAVVRLTDLPLTRHAFDVAMGTDQ